MNELKLARKPYAALSSRQKENYNFQKISAILADYGFSTIRLTDDWNGADFIAQHCEGAFYKVQLKGRLSFYEKYRGKNLLICFRDGDDWYLYPHDKLLARVLETTKISQTKSWKDGKGYSFPSLNSETQTLLKPYQIQRL